MNKYHVKRICQTCRIEFLIPRSDVKYGRGKYCSSGCYKRTGETNPKWKGGEVIRGGYIYLHRPEHPHATNQGYVCEHRLVVEDRLGRYLTKGEVVHHLNGIKNDNRSENLMVVTKAEHTHIHKDGVKHTPEHVQKRFANRKKADMSRFKRNALGKFTGTI